MFARPKNYIIAINSNQQLDPDEVGNVGVSLSGLAATGVNTPPAFIVTGTAFDDFLTANNLVEKVSVLLDQLDKDDLALATTISEEITILILQANFPSIVLNPLVQAYKELSGFTDKYIHLRPSWILPIELIPAESSDYEFLNIISEGSLLYHIKQSWAALFSPQALLNRLRYGYQGGLSIAVAVQKMVQAEVSGSAFSNEPITMNPNIAQIEALLGISPQNTHHELRADVYKVDTTNWQITEKHILEQTEMLLRKGRTKPEEDPIIKVQISAEWRRKQKLPDFATVQLAQIVTQLSKHYKHAVEIDWVYETGKIYVTWLQEYTKLEMHNSELSHILRASNLSAQIEAMPTLESDAKGIDMDSLVVEVNSLIEQTVEDSPTVITPPGGVLEEEIEQLEQEETTQEVLAQLSRPVEPPKQIIAPAAVVTPPIVEPTLSVEPMPTVEAVVDTGSIMDKLPPELRARIEKAAAEAPKEPEAEEPKEPEVKPEPKQKSILDEVEIEVPVAKEIVITKPIKETYVMTTNVYLEISAMDSGTLANGSKFDGVYLDGTAMIMRHKILPESLSSNQDDLRKLIEAYALEISTAAKAVGNKPFFYSFSDIGDVQRKELLGQAPNETGLDGSERFVLKPEALITELLAVKKAKNVYGANNINLVLPKLRTELEIVETKKIMNTQNFRRTPTTQLYAEVATPSFLYELEHTEASDLDGVIVNFAKLAQAMTGRPEFASRDFKPILSAIRLMLDYNRNKQFNFMIKVNNNPELIRAAFEAKINPSTLIFSEIPSADTFDIIKRYELAPLKKTVKRGRKIKDL